MDGIEGQAGDGGEHAGLRRAAAAPAGGPKPAGAGTVRSPTGSADPSKYAAQHLDAWIAADDQQSLIDHYAFLNLSSHRKRVLEWAVAKARKGDLRPLLAIGVEDQDAPVRHHLTKLLDSLPVDLLIPRFETGAYSPLERRSIAGILGRCKAPEAGRLLAGLAEHEEWRVRESAVKALAYYPPADGLQIPLFRRHLEGQEHSDVRLEAARGLLRLGTPAALRTLEETLAANPPTPQIAALVSQFRARQGTPSGEEALPAVSSYPAFREKEEERRRHLARRNAFLIAVAAATLTISGWLLVREMLTRASVAEPLPGEEMIFNRAPAGPGPGASQMRSSE